MESQIPELLMSGGVLWKGDWNDESQYNLSYEEMDVWGNYYRGGVNLVNVPSKFCLKSDLRGQEILDNLRQSFDMTEKQTVEESNDLGCFLYPRSYNT